MSRTNTKTARKLRTNDDDTDGSSLGTSIPVDTKKQVLKTSLNPHTTTATFQLLASTASEYEEKMSKLNAFKNKSKTKTKANVVKLEWEKELRILSKHSFSLEAEVVSLLEVVLLHTPDDTELVSLLGEVEESNKTAGESRREAADQINDVKSMLGDVIKHIKEQKSRASLSQSQSAAHPPAPQPPRRNGSNAPTSGKTFGRPAATLTQSSKQQQQRGTAESEGAEGIAASEDEPAATAVSADPMQLHAVSVFASSLLTIKDNQRQWMAQLTRAEDELMVDVRSGRRSISMMLSSDRLAEQNDRLRGDLMLIEGDDVADIEIHVQDWMHKLDLLDKGHDIALRVNSMERLEAASSLGLVTRPVATARLASSSSSSSSSISTSTTTAGTRRSTESSNDDNNNTREAKEEDRYGRDGESTVQMADDGDGDGDGDEAGDSTTAVPVMLVNGGWDDDEHNLFVKIFKETNRPGFTGGRALMTQSMISQLPHRSLQDISLHEEWYRAMKSFANRRKELIVAYETSRSALIAQAIEHIVRLREQHQQNLLRDEEMRQQEQARRALHQRLDELRHEKMQRDEKLSREELERLEAELKHRRMEEAKREEEAAEKKKLVNEFKQQRLEKEREELEREKERERVEEEERKKMIEDNRIHVEKRKLLLDEKENEKRRKEREAMELESQRLELLMKLASQVPYFDTIQNIESRLDHVTASVKGHEYIKGEELGRGFMPLNGFTDNKVIRDARFRLSAALHAAGVQGSAAARDIVRSMCPRPQLAIHGIL